jgi:RND family efflux transporter MFP subunit
VRATGALLLLGVYACGGSGEAAVAAGKDEASARGGGERGGGSGREGSARGGRGMTSLVLGANDVHTVALGSIESAMAIQGDLKPIEEVPVRARIEGNLETVSVREGDRVGRGQVMARFESSQEEGVQKSAEADVESARADSVNAQWNADQSAELFRAGAIPERDLRTAQQALVAATARLAAAQSRLRAATRDVEDTRVLAPTTGVVSTRGVETGEHVSRGAVLFTVVRNDVLELEASVPARFAGDVHPAMPVRFNAGGRELLGRVARISPTINPANRSVTVYLQMPNPGGALKGNTFATGRIVARTLDGVVTVPVSAIRYGQNRDEPFIYRIANDLIEHQPVELGVVDEAMGIVQIASGVQPGDRVIVGNVGAIGRGVRVQIGGGPGDRPARGRTGGPDSAGPEATGQRPEQATRGKAIRPDSSSDR